MINLLMMATVMQLADASGEIGVRYGSRELRLCDVTQLTGGEVPSQKVALQSFICGKEKEGILLTLVEDVVVEVAPKGRPYNPYTDASKDDIDVDALVYPIRGSYKEYKCFEIHRKPPGKNCELRVMLNASGSCYKSVYGDWKCGMYQLKPDEIRQDVPPPR